MGRKPEGAQALSGAERQARYRARHSGYGAGTTARPAQPRCAAGKISRARRWQAAVDALIALQAEYAAWLAALPEATREGATADALQAIVDLDLEEIAAIAPPRGFGRD